MTALVRNPGALTSENSDLTIVKGGLSDPNSIASALNGANAAISVLGNKTSKAYLNQTALFLKFARHYLHMQQGRVEPYYL
jgi:putative NADH-flavin reductase